MKRTIKIRVKNPTPRSGHYDYQSKGKAIFDSRPKRERTRANQKRHYLKEELEN